MTGTEFDALPYEKEGRRWELLLPVKTSRLDFDLSPIPGAPDLAVEVISPTDRTVECHEKVRAFLRSGSAEVWQIYEDSRALEIYTSE